MAFSDSSVEGERCYTPPRSFFTSKASMYGLEEDAATVARQHARLSSFVLPARSAFNFAVATSFILWQRRHSLESRLKTATSTTVSFRRLPHNFKVFSILTRPLLILLSIPLLSLLLLPQISRALNFMRMMYLRHCHI